MEEPTGSISQNPNTISFYTSDNEPPIIELRQNGDIYIHGKYCKNDHEVVDAMREFLVKSKLIDP